MKRAELMPFGGKMSLSWSVIKDDSPNLVFPSLGAILFPTMVLSLCRRGH